MSISKGRRLALASLMVCILAGLAALVQSANAGSASASGPAASASKVAGTVSARMVINRFRAIGKRVVGQGTVISTYKDASGATSVKRKPFRLTISERHSRQRHRFSAVQQEEPLCHVLLLEVGEVDLTLAGLHAILRAFNPEEPIQVRIQARRSGGVLGRLFCDLAQGGGALPTAAKAQLAARTLTRRTAGSTIMRASAKVYAPEQTTSGGAGTTYSAHGGATPNAPQAPTQVTECNVLHLILGPVHLDLLGLIVDINKIVLDLKGIPGTLLGDIFCQLSNDPKPPAGASKVAGTVSTRMVVNRFTAVGKRVVGQATVVSTYTDMAGATSTKRSSVRLTILKRHGFQQQGWSAVQQEPDPLCQILFLEIGEVDLTLAGLHVIARAFNPDEPIRLRLRAQRSGGILGRLFCDLSEGGGVVASKRKARLGAQSLTTRMSGTTVMRFKAVIYAPKPTTSGGLGTMSSTGATPNAPQAPMQVTECDVLHLILGPVHLDLLGLVVDINKIVLDLKGIPGTLLGDIFCQLSNTPPLGGASKVAGTVTTRMVVDGFKAVGNRVVGQGTAISTYTDMAGTTTVQRRTFRLTIPKRHVAQQQGWSALQQEPEPLCKVLFLEIGEVDLTLAGLHVIAHAFNPDEPIRLLLRARRSGGILGRLFCDLAQGGGVVPTKRKARIGAQALTTRMSGSTIMRFQAVVYAPNQATSGNAGTLSSMGGGAAPNAPQAPMQVTECHVLHLILGPVHLDLLGLIADLNKIVVDVNAVPGTLLGDIFCLLSSDPKPPPPPAPPPPPPPPPPAPAYAR